MNKKYLTDTKYHISCNRHYYMYTRSFVITFIINYFVKFNRIIKCTANIQHIGLKNTTYRRVYFSVRDNRVWKRDFSVFISRTRRY